uniref:Uncharacterized protein n=1 Tax=Piliocolobus tephrosceles TaxID=591936 RepID=A0A8C9J0P4_9PRIM
LDWGGTGWGRESTLNPAGASVQEPRLAQPSLGSPIPCALYPMSISTNQGLPDTCSGVAMGTRRGECGAHSCPWTHRGHARVCPCSPPCVHMAWAPPEVFTQRCTRTPLQVCTCPTRLRPQVCVCSRTRSGSPPTPHTVHSDPGGHTCLGAPGSLSPCHLCVHVCAHTSTPVCAYACPGTRGSPSPRHLHVHATSGGLSVSICHW